MQFVKMHGAGNDYIYVDGFRDALPPDPATTAVEVSDRHGGVGADGLILICPSEVADAEMQVFNADGSAAEMCGNGLRCVAKYLFDRKIVKRREMTVATGDGIKQLEIFAKDGVAERVRVDMGIPQLAAKQIPTLISANVGDRVVNASFPLDDDLLQVTCVSMGNPHCVVFFDGECSADGFCPDELVLSLGPRIERDARFPARVNVEFVHVDSENEVHQRTWERGSGETLACGTGASAVCVAGVLMGRTNRQVRVHLKGGTLDVTWDDMTNHVWMTGPAVEVFRGEIDLD